MSLLSKAPKQSPFEGMLLRAIGGLVIGMVTGLAFALLIATVSHLFADPRMGDMGGVPLEVASFFGMGIGAVVGAILGGTTANKQ